MKQGSYRIKSLIMQSGERYCLLVDRASGMPLYYPNLYVTTQVRNNSKSVATMQSALSGIDVLLSFCGKEKIDLVQRFLKREFFALHEMDAIRDYCQLDFSKGREGPSEGTAPIDRVGKRKPTRTTGQATVYLRLTRIANYTEWLATILLSGEIDRNAALSIARMKKGFESRRPAGKGRNQIKREKGLSKEQVDILLEVVRPGSEKNPFEDKPTQVRNELIILLLLHLGIRGGELLNIRVSDINFSTNQIVIARRPDDKKDPRPLQPLVKTLDRRAPMKDTLVQAVHRYVTEFRRKIPGARRHNYLLVTHKSGPTQGQPLSRSSYVKIINQIAGADPEIADLHGHELRHTWNNRFSELMDGMDQKPNSAGQEAARSYLQGWKPDSGTAAVYTKRSTREKAMEASLKLQEGITRVPENLKND